jgi:hypothetical protein
VTDYPQRGFVRDMALVSGGVLFLDGWPSGPQSTSRGTGGASGSNLGKIEGAQRVTDAASIPKTFKESPEFARLVAKGKLPPVADRVGKSPLVLKPVQGVGKYGGQIRRGSIGNGDTLNAVEVCSFQLKTPLNVYPMTFYYK